MNISTQFPNIERLEFFNGQRLFAEDLQTLDGFNRQMRWLHNRSLHTFGIGSGFVVRGERGDREVSVAPGYAVDNEGREIILLLPRTEAVPPVADDGSGNPRFYDLTVHYPRTEDLEELETRGGICRTHGVIRRREEPVFCWVELKAGSPALDPTGLPQLDPVNDKHRQQIATGEKIVLARISVKNCRLETLSIAIRRNVKPERLPYVACGRTPLGGTVWKTWGVDFDNSPPTDVIIGVETVVDTSAANFASVPCYTARVVGERVFPGSNGGFFILEGFTSVDPGSSSTRFTLRVNLAVTNQSVSFLSNLAPLFFTSNFPLNPANTVNQQIGDFLKDKWYVEWMGVEG